MACAYLQVRSRSSSPGPPLSESEDLSEYGDKENGHVAAAMAHGLPSHAPGAPKEAAPNHSTLRV